MEKRKPYGEPYVVCDCLPPVHDLQEGVVVLGKGK
jgi:hypothetical protein